MRRTLLIILSAIIALTTIHPPYAKAAESHAVPRSLPIAHVPSREPMMMRMVDCEDYNVQPCYTYDEGAYRMVLSYSPYRAVKLVTCKVEDGGPILPCIWKRNNRVAKGQPITRNVFTR